MERISMKVLVSVAVLLAVTAMVSAPAWAGNCHKKSPASADAAKKTDKISAVKAQCGEKLDKISAVLEAAKSAADAGDAKTAAAEIAKAQAQLAELKQFRSDKCSYFMSGKEGKADGECKMKGQATSADKAGVVNATCPMMGSKIDPAKVTEPLTRSFDGKQVGFCCGGCPAKWDALSDADRQAKLKTAM